MEKVSIILPIYKLSKNRLRNFSFVLERILNCSEIYEIIVTEQIDPNLKVHIRFSEDPRLKRVTTTIDDDKFHKATIINKGILASTGDFIWLHDVDVYAPFSDIVKTIQPGHLIIQPFSHFVKFWPNNTHTFITKAEIEVNPYKSYRIFDFAECSIIFRKDILLSLRGLNEIFTGYGGCALEIREKTKDIFCTIFSQYNGVHLWHDPEENINDLRKEDSNKFFPKVKSVIKNQGLSKYIKSMVSSIQLDDDSLVNYSPKRYTKKFSNDIIEDSEVIIVFYGPSKLRVDATKKSFKHLLNQKALPHITFLELLYNNNTSFPELQEYDIVRHIKIQAKEKNVDLWQKECLLNIAANQNKSKDKLIFLDSDIFSTDPEWMTQLCDRLNNYDAVQGFRVFKDTVDHNAFSNHIASATVHYIPYNEHSNFLPGACWGITTKYFNSIDGFNPLALAGSGDTLFIWECIVKEGQYYPNRTIKHKWFQNIIRKGLPKARVSFIDCELKHQHHGFFSNRRYHDAHGLLDKYITNKVDDYIGIDSKGLLYWKDINCQFRKELKSILDGRGL